MTRAAFWRAWSIWAVTMAITATAIGYDALHPLPAELAANGGNGLDMVVGLTFIFAFATVGALLAWKRPGNPIGWLLSGSGLAYALGGFGLLLGHFPRTLALGDWLGLGPGCWAWGCACSSCCCSPPGACRPAAGGRWPGPPGRPWPDGSWATCSPLRSSRPTRRPRTRSA